MIRVVIVSDIRLYREGLEEILDRDDSVCIVGTASDVEQAIVEINNNTPNVVLLDMTMIASCEAIAYIMSSCPDTKVIALAITEDENTILACARAGIAGYVSREASVGQLINTICGVDGGEFYCPRRIAASLIHKLKSLPKVTAASQDEKAQPVNNSKMALLTLRERQIASLVYEGLSNKQIAHNLTIEVSTVKNHVHNILTKIGARSRTQVVSILHQHMSSD